MMKPIHFRIVQVDRCGYNGRDKHPSQSDVGLLVAPLKMDAYYTDAAGGECPMFGWDRDDEHRPAAGPELAFSMTADYGNCEGIVMMWTCMTRDGRVLQLMDHEIEQVQ
jgi:hypothetical protein